MFLPSGWLTPVLPPTDESTWAITVVGTCRSMSLRCEASRLGEGLSPHGQMCSFTANPSARHQLRILKATGRWGLHWRHDRQVRHRARAHGRAVLHLQEVDAALVGSRREAGHVADDAAAERHKGRAPVQGGPHGSVPHALHLYTMRPHLHAKSRLSTLL